MIDLINQGLTKFTDFLLIPFQGVPKIWGLIFLSFLSGIFLLLCYGKVSNQKAIKNVKRSIMASLFESVLYRQNLRLCLRAQWRMLVGGCKYFLIAIPPILVLMIPCVLMLAQLNLRYESDGVLVGKPVLLRVKANDVATLNDVILKTSDNVEVTPRLRNLEDKEVIWRLIPKDKKNIDLDIVLEDGKTLYKKTVIVSDPTYPHVVSRTVQNIFDAVLYPGEKVLPSDSVISEILIEYPSVSYSWLGISWHWLILFLVVSIISGLMASKIFGVAV